MELPVGMRIIYDVKHCHATRLKFGDTSLTSLTKLVIEAKANICTIISDIKRP